MSSQLGPHEEDKEEDKADPPEITCDVVDTTETEPFSAHSESSEEREGCLASAYESLIMVGYDDMNRLSWCFIQQDVVGDAVRGSRRRMARDARRQRGKGAGKNIINKSVDWSSDILPHEKKTKLQRLS